MTTLDHLILSVNDIDESVRFYTEILGLAQAEQDGPFSVVRVSATTTLQLAPWGTDGGEHLAFAMTPEDFDAAFAQVDFIVTPTSPSVAFGLGEKTGDPWSMYINDFCTVPMSLAGIPAISIPCGLSGVEAGLGPGGAGLPVGFQIAGPVFSENRLLDAAHALECAIGFDGSAARA